MAKLRGLGGFAQLLLQAHLKSKAAKDENDLITERQHGLAEFEDSLRRETDEHQAGLERGTAKLRELGQNPALAMTLSQSGDKEAGPFIQRNSATLAKPMESISKASEMKDLPSMAALFGQRSPGIIDNLAPLTEMFNAREAQSRKITDSNSYEDDRSAANEFSKQYAQKTGEEAGLGATSTDRTARTIKETNETNKGTFDEKFFEEQKMENMKAAIQLKKEKDALLFKLAEEGRSADAKELNSMVSASTAAILSLNEIMAHATEINAGYQEGGIDTYAGLKDAAGQVPLIGSALSKGMTTASAAVASHMGDDPSIPRKVNVLEGLRREAAIAAIRAAGDPRPSDADVLGVIPSIPGAFESLEATASKAQRLRDSLTMIPTLLANNPGLKGKALLDMAMAEAAKKSTERATSGGAGNRPTGAGLLQRTTPQAGGPPAVVQSILGRGTPAERPVQAPPPSVQSILNRSRRP